MGFPCDIVLIGVCYYQGGICFDLFDMDTLIAENAWHMNGVSVVGVLI